MEEKIFFKSDDLLLEGLLGNRIGDCAAIITHPHPLYGGNMYNLVVEKIMDAYAQFGFTTLRFNFRGNGQSQGTFDNGPGERRDVCAALSFLKARGYEQIHLAGYSFGAWVNAGISCENAAYEKMIMVSPPTAFIDFGKPVALSRLALVVTGSHDEIAPAESINPYLKTWNPSARFEIIPGADHFYSYHMDRLAEIVVSYLAQT
jgi:alpha/beta superfamily hydrolase